MPQPHDPTLPPGKEIYRVVTRPAGPEPEYGVKESTWWTTTASTPQEAVDEIREGFVEAGPSYANHRVVSVYVRVTNWE